MTTVSRLMLSFSKFDLHVISTQHVSRAVWYWIRILTISNQVVRCFRAQENLANPFSGLHLVANNVNGSLLRLLVLGKRPNVNKESSLACPEWTRDSLVVTESTSPTGVMGENARHGSELQIGPDIRAGHSVIPELWNNQYGVLAKTKRRTAVMKINRLDVSRCDCDRS